MEIKARENRKGQSSKNIQSRDTDNIGHTKHRRKTKKRELNVDIKFSGHDVFLE